MSCRQKQRKFQNWLMMKLVPFFKLKTKYLLKNHVKLRNAKENMAPSTFNLENYFLSMFMRYNVKKTLKFSDKHPGLFLYFRIRFKKRLRAESKIFFQPNPNIMIFDFFSFFYPPPPFLVSNEK